MTHDQIVAALQRGYKVEDARESRRGFHPIRKPAPRTKPRRMGDARLPSDKPDPTGFGDGLRHLRRWKRKRPGAPGATRRRTARARACRAVRVPRRRALAAEDHARRAGCLRTRVRPAAWGPYGPQN
jgi:hypothetical protein